MMRLFKKKIITFITVEINGKAYDYPKDLPLPRIGELVLIDNSHFGKVNRISHQIDGNYFRMITISTEEA